MKTSEYIQKLQALMEKHGDLEVMYREEDHRGMDPEDLRVADDPVYQPYYKCTTCSDALHPAAYTEGYKGPAAIALT